MLRSFQATLLSSMFSSFTIPPENILKTPYLLLLAQVAKLTCALYAGTGVISFFLGLLFPGATSCRVIELLLERVDGLGGMCALFMFGCGDGGNRLLVTKASKEMIHATKTLCIVILRRFQMIQTSKLSLPVHA